ncbi:MAG: hypothetical protein MZV63_68320 [Marinilabiliales bacterium]|nr:hypothetical protein [Marinilabiliales bacterium]
MKDYIREPAEILAARIGEPGRAASLSIQLHPSPAAGEISRLREAVPPSSTFTSWCRYQIFRSATIRCNNPEGIHKHKLVLRGYSLPKSQMT